MKNSFSILTIYFLSLSSLISYPFIENQKRPHRNDSISASDTVSNYSVTTNGRVNSVQITQNGQTVKSGEAKQAKKEIEVNGEQNSVNITENRSGGTIRIRQNGNQNKINITQTDGKINK